MQLLIAEVREDGIQQMWHFESLAAMIHCNDERDR